MPDTSSRLTVLETRGGVKAVKTYRKIKGSIDVENYGKAKKFTARTIEVDARGKWLKRLLPESESFVVLGQPENWAPGEVKRRLSVDREGAEATLVDVPRSWMPIDVDKLTFESLATLDDGETLAVEVLDELGVPNTACVWQFTNSHAVFGKQRIRLWVPLSKPLTALQMRELVKLRWPKLVEAKLIDTIVYRPAQPIYTGRPIFVDMEDPVRRRVGYIEGDELRVKVPRVAASRAHTSEDPNIEKLIEAGLYISRYNKAGQHCIECPWEDEHGEQEKRDDDTFYYEPHYGGYDVPAFICHHGSHKDSKHWSDVAQKLGITETFKPVLDEDDDEEERDFVYVHRLEQFFDPRDGEMLTIKAYDSMHGLKAKKGKPHEKFITDPKTLKADRIAFMPGAPRISTVGGVRVLNTYIDKRLRPDPAADATPFIEHVEWLIPNDDEREHVIDWLAHVYQKPGVKITWAPILYGVPGTGKTTLMLALAHCIGLAYVSEPTQRELEDKFNEWAFGKLFVKIEELMSGDKYHVAEQLKPVIANPTVSIRGMHKAGFSVPNTANVCASTNHMQALPIERGDRRYMIVECVDAPKHVREPKIRALWKWIHKNGWAGVAHWFASRDLSHFKAAGEAPDTRLKTVVQEASKTDLERAIDLCAVFDSEEIVTSSTVSEYLENNENKLHAKRIGLIAARRNWAALPDGKSRTRKGGRFITIWSPLVHHKEIKRVLAMPSSQRDTYLTNLEHKQLNASSGTFGPITSESADSAEDLDI